MVKPYYEHDGVTIYHGDARDILPRLRGGADLVLTDPPYGIGYVTSWRSRSDRLRSPIAGDRDLAVFRDSWPACLDALRTDRHFYVFASPRRWAEVNEIVGAKQALCWDKGDRGTVGDLSCGFGESFEVVLYGMKGRRPLRGPRPRTVVRVDWSGAMDPVHPTVKPVHLLRKMVEWSSDEGETILDPFMGSGTTLRAAKDLHRKAIGIEVSEEYCELAARRLSQGVLNFGEA